MSKEQITTNLVELIELTVLENLNGARSRNRTGTEFNLRRILSPVCLPISPPGLMSIQTVRIIYDRLVKFFEKLLFMKEDGNH